MCSWCSSKCCSTHWCKIISMICLVILNLIFFLVIGVSMLYYPHKFVKYNAILDIQPIIALSRTAGVLICAIAVFGVVATCMRNRLLLEVYGCTLIVTIIFHLVVGTFILVKRENTTKIKNHLKDFYSRYSGDEHARSEIDNLQMGLKCCGYKGSSDREVQAEAGGLILSCCPKKEHTCTMKVAHKENCSSKIIKFFRYDMKALGIFVICSGIFEVSAVLLAWFMHV